MVFNKIPRIGYLILGLEYLLHLIAINKFSFKVLSELIEMRCGNFTFISPAHEDENDLASTVKQTDHTF